MTQDEAKAIATVIERLTDNARQRIEQAEQSARADAVTRAEADRVRIEALSEDLRKEREAHAETTDYLNRASAQLREAAVQKELDLKTAQVLQHREGESLLSAARRVVKERDGLLTQVQDMRAEMERLKSQMAEQEVSVVGVINERNEAWERCDALRAEVAALKSQTPKHPVKVGEWVKRLNPIVLGSGTIAKVLSINENDRPPTYTVEHIDGNEEFWFISNCEPCDPPEATHDTPDGRSVAEAAVKREPKPGDVVRLVRVPTPDEYPHDTGRWEPNWGGIGDYMRVHHVGNNISGTRIVRAVFGLEWPISCVEIVSDEPDEIKVGDLVEVVSNRGRNTWFVDVGSFGTVTSVEEINESISVHLDDEPGKKNALAGYVSFCDVRKVTT